MDDAVRTALNTQIKLEFEASYAYLQAAAYFEHRSLDGFGRWIRLQSQEETSHAMKLFDFLLDRGASIALTALDQPHATFTSALDVFQRALQHEQAVTGQIDRLYALALDKKDYAAQVLLQWFISEQVEEEKNASRTVEQLKLVGDNATALLLLDGELGGRSAKGA